MNNSISDLPDVPELCARLQRETNALAVLILGEEGDILGHAGQPAALADPVVDAIADATAETLQRAARNEPPQDPDDHVAQVGAVQVCAAPVAAGAKAVLLVVFDGGSNLALVRLRMKRAREQILRSLEPA